MGKEIVNQVQAAQSFKQDKPKEEHTDTYSNQTDRKLKTDKILKATRKITTNNIQGNSHQAISWFLNRNSTSQKGMAQYIESDEREEPTAKNTLPQQGSDSDLMENKVFQTRKS